MTAAKNDVSLSVARQLDAVCDRFEADRKAGKQPKIESFLGTAGGADRAELLRLLLRLEIELSARQGQQSSQASLEARFPADADVVQSVFRELALQTTSQKPASVDTSVSQESARPAAVSTEVPKRIGRFEVLAVLGQGGFGRVYRARDPQLDREVAIKVPLRGVLDSQDEIDRFLHEARAAATLQHPNVCPVHEVGQENGGYFLVMGYVEGKSLAALLKERKEPLPTRQAALLVRKLALALSAAHAKGIVHRDLKPANLMIERTRKDVVVMDFGLARHRRPGDAHETREGVIMGTPAYMAPEQARGEVQAIGPASDIYSLGVILYELLAGKPPFRGSLGEVLGKVLHVEPEPASKHRPGLDPRLEAICQKAMAKNPLDRFVSMKALADALDDYLKGTAPAPQSSSVTPAPADTSPVGLTILASALEAQEKGQAHRFHRLTAVLGGGLAAIVVLLASIFFFVRSGPATIIIQVPLPPGIDLKDTALTFFLDKKPVSAEELNKPIELKVGAHELLIMRGDREIQRMRFAVGMKGKEVAVEVKELTGTPEEAPSAPAKPELPGPLVFDHSLSKTDTLENFWNSGGGVAVVPGKGLQMGPGNFNPISWARPYLGDRYRAQFDVQFSDQHLGGCVLNGPGCGNSPSTGYWCFFNQKTFWLEREGVRAQTIQLPKPLTPGEWATMQADVSGGEIAVSINGVAITKFSDAEPLTGPLHGWFGLTANTALFRNLRIWTTAKDTDRERQLTAPATAKPLANGELLYELKLPGRDLGPEWWKLRPEETTAANGAMVFSAWNVPSAAVLDKPLPRDIACEAEFTYHTPRAFSIGVMLWFAKNAPRSAQECAGGWVVELPTYYGKNAVQWHRGPQDGSKDPAHRLGSNGPIVAATQYSAPIPERRYRARVESRPNDLRVFLDGSLLLTAKPPDGAALPDLPAFLGLRHSGGGDATLKVHAVRVYKLEPEEKAKP